MAKLRYVRIAGLLLLARTVGFPITVVSELGGCSLRSCEADQKSSSPSQPRSLFASVVLPLEEGPRISTPTIQLPAPRFLLLLGKLTCTTTSYFCFATNPLTSATPYGNLLSIPTTSFASLCHCPAVSYCRYTGTLIPLMGMYVT